MHNDRFLAAALALAAAVLPALSAEPRESSFDRTLTVSGPVDLDAATHSGHITVRAGAPGSVTIRGIIRAGRIAGASDERVRQIEQNPPVRQEGNAIRIEALTGAARRGLSLGYEITVPAQTSVRARSGSGAASVEGVRGPADISTGSSGVAVARVAGEVRAHTGSGDISATGIAGPIVARTGSGRITLEQTAAAPVTARTGSGAVEARLPRNAGFDLRAHTGSGRITSERAMTVRGSMSGRSLEGQLGGGGPLVDLSTGSGAIRID